MFPYINDFFYKHGISNYIILVSIGLFSAIICFHFLSLKTKLPQEVYFFYLFLGVASLIVGLISAFLFQSLYNYIETGKFQLKGMTVMGGILGGTVFFCGSMFVLRFTKLGKQYTPYFWRAINLCVPALVIAQFFGRLGCFAAGCCYGKETDSFLGTTFVEGYTTNGEKVLHGHPRLPTQAFEAIFMLVLFIVIIILLLKLKKPNLSLLIYAYAYPIFRFFIEFARDDHRGAFLLGMSPSQIQSIVWLFAAIVLTIILYRFTLAPFKQKE